MGRSLYNLLVRSFDSRLSDKDRRRVDSALAASEKFRAIEEDLKILRSALRSKRGSTFNAFFVERVIERLRNSRQSVDEYFVSVFRDLVAGAAVLVILLSAYNISRTNGFTLESAFGIHHPSLDQILTLEAPFE
jgi:anti-sigma factor RsiW